MKKRILSALMAICMVALAVVAPAPAQAADLNNFQRTQAYTDGQYSDVPASHTFSANVRSGYEFGIMQGYGEKFGVGDNITRMASIIVACRLNCIYESGANTIDQTYPGSTQERYLAYAKDHDIYRSFQDYAQPASRAEFAAILSSAMPDVALKAVNHVDDNAIPDVKDNTANAYAIYRLYRAGIINGSDAKGTFYPNANITRGAACAIATRICDPSLRKSVNLVKPAAPSVNPSDFPVYSDEPYMVVNRNIPYFTETDKLQKPGFEFYSELDGLGRCGFAFANVGAETMPTAERGPIGMVKPSGWHTVKYEGVDGKYLYNRCHLLGYQLTAENANVKNLITGTRYMNVIGMLPFENMVADYVRETGNHVLYRVTPVFEGNNLLASGVLMEALSVEDNGGGICFNVYCYNAQPGIFIDYGTGESFALDEVQDNTEPEYIPDYRPDYRPDYGNDYETEPIEGAYVLNINTHKFHRPDCSSVRDMSEHNKRYYDGPREDLIAQGFDPCGRCNP